MRTVIVCATLLALLLPACGGGTTAAVAPNGGGSANSAVLQGTVYEQDGQTVNRAGIPVTIVETGATVFTAFDGSFTFDGLAPGVYTLDFGGADDGFGDASEDALGRPLVEVEDGVPAEIRVALHGTDVAEFSIENGNSKSGVAKIRLEAEPDFALVEGKLKVGAGRHHEGMKIKVEPVALTDEVEVFLDDGSGAGFVSVGLATIDFDDDGDHDAIWKRDLNAGESLPLGALTPADMVGWDVRIDINGVTAFTGTIPEIPTQAPNGGGGNGGPDGAQVSKVDLTLLAPGIDEAEVELFSWPAQNKQRFEMEIEGTGLAAGDLLAFEIEDVDNPGEWILIKQVTVVLDDDDDDPEGEAEVDTKDGDAFPLGVTDVADLVGLDVRIRRDEIDDTTVIAEGTIAPLVNK